MSNLMPGLYADRINDSVEELNRFKEYIAYKTFPVINTPFHIVLCGETFKTENYVIPRKKSIYLNVEYVLDGELVVEMGTKKHFVTAGKVLILPPSVDQYYYSNPTNPVDKLFFLVTGSLPEIILNQYEIGDNYIFEIDALDIFKTIIDAAADKENSQEDIDNIACVEFLKLIHLIKSRNSKPDVNTPAEAIVLKEYIDLHLRERITVEMLSKLIYKSTTHTNRLFKSTYGVSPYKYISDARLKLAQEYLINTDLSIKEIAFMVGFNDEHYFSNFFYEKLGRRPRELRRYIGDIITKHKK